MKREMINVAGSISKPVFICYELTLFSSSNENVSDNLLKFYSESGKSASESASTSSSVSFSLADLFFILLGKNFSLVF